MTFGGWLLMLVSLGSVLCLCTFCYWRVLTAPHPKTGPKIRRPVDE